MASLLLRLFSCAQCGYLLAALPLLIAQNVCGANPCFPKTTVTYIDDRMKVMLFAAGLGTRLRPLTDSVPKALVPVAGHPLLDIVLRHLVAQGANEVVINVHHLGDQIIQYVNAHDWGIPVRVSDERGELLDTGGGLRKAASLFTPDSRPILIHNVDILSDAPLRDFYERHLHDEAALMVSGRSTQRYLLFDEGKRLVGWTNTSTGKVRTPYDGIQVQAMRHWAFSGIHCFSPRLFELMQSFPAKFSIMDFYLQVCQDVRIQGDYCEQLHLLDVGKQDTLKQAEIFYKEFVEPRCRP